MPFENRPAEKSSLEKQSQEQQRELILDVFYETMVLPATLAAGYTAVNAASDSLTRNTLQTLPAERQGLTKWWQANSSSAQQELFAAQEKGLARYVTNASTARAMAVSAYENQLMVAKEIIPHTADLEARVSALEKASPATLKAEANGLTNMTWGTKERSLAEATKFLKSPNLMLHSPHTIDVVSAYRDALRAPNFYGESFRLTLDTAAKEMHLRADSILAREFDLERLRTQHQTLSELGSAGSRLEAKAVLRQIGTAREVYMGEKLFVYGSKLGDLVTKAAGALEQRQMTMGERAVNEGALLSEVEKSSKVLGSQAEHAASRATGRLMTALGIAAFSTCVGGYTDYLLSQQLKVEMSDTRDRNAARLAIDGCLVPAFLLSDVPLRYRIPLAATAFGVGRVANLLASNISLSPKMTELLRPNQADTFLIGGAVMAPLGARYKAMSIAGALATGRIVNMF